MKRLEGEVLDLLNELGENATRDSDANRRSASVPRYRTQSARGADRRTGAVDRLSPVVFPHAERKVIDEPILRDFGTITSERRGARLRQAGAVEGRARKADYAAGPASNEAASDHGRGDSRSRRQAAGLPYVNPRTGKMAGRGIHRRQSAVHRREGFARRIGRWLYGGAVGLARQEIGFDRLCYVLVGLRRNAAHAQGYEAAALRLHHHQFDHAEILPANSRKAFEGGQADLAHLCRT